jgi:SAM-dependent methyltransferase
MTDTVSPWVQRYAPLIPGGAVLDLACGSGRHARHLAALGHSVVAVDRDPEALALAAGAGISTSAIDLEQEGAAWPFAPGDLPASWSPTTCTARCSRRCWPALAPNGVLIYETFADGNEVFGKPSNPAFLLQPGELLAWPRASTACAWWPTRMASSTARKLPWCSACAL